MPSGRKKNPENRTRQEEIAAVLQWAECFDYGDVPPIAALRREPTAQNIRAVIRWAKGQGFFNIAEALRERALSY